MGLRCCLPALPVLLLLFPLSLALSPPWRGAGAPFNTTVAFTQLLLSYAAYCPPGQLQDWNCIFCRNTTTVSSFVPTAIITNATTNTYGYVGHFGSIAHVVFRGTVGLSLKNWITDLDAGHSTPYPFIPGAFVHTGFLDAWNSVKEQVAAAVESLTIRIKPTEVYFSGHSLGAALSVLAAVEIGTKTGLPVTCYNFGEPRVGNKLFADYFDAHIQTSWRMVNQYDIVPHVPGESLGFWHIATEVWQPNKTQNFMICNGSGEDPKCSNSLGLGAVSIEDHLDYMGVQKNSGHASGCL